jgi:GGDEF domain-containing protein
MLPKELEKYSSNNKDIQLEMSIGFAFSDYSIGNMGKLYAEADKNMYLNKKGKKGI